VEHQTDEGAKMNGPEENRRRGQRTSGLKSTASGMQAAGQAEGGTSSAKGPVVSDLADLNPHDICSPHELIGWVDDVLEKLEAKFGRIEADVMDRLDVLGKRIDSLELSMSGLLDGATTLPIATTTTATSSATATHQQQPAEPSASTTT